MALIQKGKKIINVTPPKLNKEQKKAMDDSPINYKLINRALSRKFKVIYSKF